MRLLKIALIAIVALVSATTIAEAQQRYTLGDSSNNEIADSVDFDLNAPVFT